MDFLSPVVQHLVPYVPGEQPQIANLLKLNTNENPYPPSAAVLATLQRAALQGLQLYPDPESSTLCQALGEYHGLSAQQVFVGNGSDEVLAHAFFAFFQQSCPLLMPDISYSFYQVYCQLYGIHVHTVPLRDDLSLNVADYAQALAGPVAGMVIANPNAPTGMGLPLTDLLVLLRLYPRQVLLVDEAYVDFGGHSALALIDRHPNLLVVRTFSKARSLAGLRIGYACGQAHLIDALRRVKNSFNSYPLDRLAQAGALASLEDQDSFAHHCQAIIDSREGLVLALEDLGFAVLPSQANFVFVRHLNHSAAELAAGLRARGVLVRHFKQARIDNYLRITVGTPQQCDRLIQTLAEFL